MRTAAIFFALTIAIAPGVAAAQACTQTDAGLAAPFQAWTSKASLASATKPDQIGADIASEGQTFDVALHPVSEITWAATPQKPAANFGGMLELKPSVAGTYVIAAGAGAWLDVAKDGKTMSSSAFGHGPACSTIRKQVEFKLEPGRYVLQILGAPEA